jgi:hypothetical protein
MKKFTFIAFSVFTLTAAASAAVAQQPAKVGTLTCDISGGVGMIVTSQKTMACTFAPTKGAKEVYTGSITKFGLDVGATSGGPHGVDGFSSDQPQSRRTDRDLHRRDG